MAFVASGWGFEVLDEADEDVDVEGFRHERQITDREGTLAVFFARVTRDGYRGNFG